MSSRRFLPSSIARIAALACVNAVTLLALLAVSASGVHAELIWSEYTIDAHVAHQVYVQDINGDNRPDVVALGFSGLGLVWYEAPADPTAQWAKHIIVELASCSYMHDIDGDNAADLVASVGEEVAWYEAPDDPTQPWLKHTIDPSGRVQWTLSASDLNGDGHPDVVASGPALVWYEAPSDPTGSWTKHVIDSKFWPYYLIIHDINGDGHPDIVTADFGGETVTWYEAPTDPTGLWTKHVMDPHLDAYRLFVADIDGDGNPEVVASGFHMHTVAWYEPSGDPTAPWTKHVISADVDGADGVFVADIDVDNHPDVVVAEYNKGNYLWFEAPDDPTGSWTRHTIGTTNMRGANDVFVYDLDGDNAPEIVTAADMSRVSWYDSMTIPGCPIAATATGSGTAEFCQNTGTVQNLQAVAESTLPTEGKPYLAFPHGFFEFEITGLTAGQTVNLTITLPSSVPIGTNYWKYGPTQSENTGHWYEIPVEDDDGDRVISINLTDGDIGDDDLTRNGVIIDQGGPGVAPGSPPPQGHWSVPQPIGFMGGGPSLIQDANGNLRCAFGSADGNSGIWWSTFSNGSWSVPEAITSTSGRDGAPSLIQDSEGNFHLAFCHWNGDTGQGMLDIYWTTNTGSGWSSPVRLTTYADDDGPPSLIEDSNGDLHIVFERTIWYSGYGCSDLYWMTYHNGAWSSPTAITITPTGENYPSLIQDSTGDLVLVYATYSFSGNQICLMRYTAGVWSSPSIIFSCPYNEYPECLSLIEADDGALWVAFPYRYEAGGGPMNWIAGIYVIANHNGSWSTPSWAVSPTLNSNIGKESMVQDSEGNLVISFSCSGGAIYWTTSNGLPLNTPVGSNVPVSLPNSVVTFSNVSRAGTTTITTSQGNPGGGIPEGFRVRGLFIDISTTAFYTGPVSVCLNYSDTGIGNEHNLKLFHWNGTGWDNVTTSIDPATNTICGQVSGLSPFFVGEEVAQTGGAGFPSGGGGCFIATAAYGTPMAEDIQVLREFRDRYLITNPVGEKLVSTYYRVSPPMADYIVEHSSLKPLVRFALQPAIVFSSVAINTTPMEKIAIALVILTLLFVMRERKGQRKAT